MTQSQPTALPLTREDLTFIHDALLSAPFQGDGMMRAASIVTRLRGFLVPAHVPSPPASPAHGPAPEAPAEIDAAEALRATLAAAPPPTILRDVASVPAPAPTVHAGGKKSSGKK